MKTQIDPSKLGIDANGRERLTGQFSNNRKAVLFLTGMNEQRLEDFVITTLADWLDWHLKVPANETSSELLHSSMLIKWWKYNWQYADDQFILELLFKVDSSDALVKYRRLHQYVFDLKNRFTQYLIEDFRTLFSDFQKDAIQAQKTQNEGV